jgi:4-phospho-D-threonate 3-dehydrogenase / 4-phospho-D-erythronate 3-dehydrogenase
LDEPENKHPRIAITLGDTGGVGPEIALKAALSPEVKRICEPLLVGSAAVVREAAEVVGAGGAQVRAVEHPRELDREFSGVLVVETHTLAPGERTVGEVSATSGRAAAEDTRRAVELALAGDVDAVVSGPVNKQGLRMAGYDYPGQTEYFQDLTGAGPTFTILAGGPMRVVLLSTHVSLREAIELVTRDRVADVVRKLDAALKEAFGIERPQIGVAGLNPHSGDKGLMGREEIEEIEPALESSREAEIDVVGPVPADAFFVQGEAGAYDGMVALYHDQGVIPLKRHRYATFAYGLPIVRTTPGHGTAYDIAGTGKADPTAMLNAVFLAVSIFAGSGRGR